MHALVKQLFHATVFLALSGLFHFFDTGKHGSGWQAGTYRSAWMWKYHVVKKRCYLAVKLLLL